MVSKGEHPPCLLVEGFTRLAALLLKVLEGKSYGETVPVILGIGERLNEWSFA